MTVHQTALVGAAHIHTPGFMEKQLPGHPDFAVKWVWDHDTGRAARWAGVLNAGVTDLDAIWTDPDIEAVFILSETNRHEPLVRSAAAAHKHMFVEKPLGTGAQDAYAMATVIEQAGVIFQTGYFMRSNPINRFLKSQIKQGHFGKITRIRLSNCHAGSLKGWFDAEWRWMADVEQAGMGGFGDLGTHALDLMLWLMGEAVTRVTGDISVVTGRYGDCDESGEGLLKFASGALGSLAAGWVDVADPVKLIISGTEGHAHVTGNHLYFQSEHVEGADGQTPWTQLPEALPHAFALFLDAVRGKRDLPLVTPHEAALDGAVMAAIYRGAAQQTWVAPAQAK